MTSNFIGDCSDSCISIAESHRFGGKIKSREDDEFFRCGGVLSVSVRKAFVVGGGACNDMNAFLKC